MELAELLERVKEATGPDPTLEGRIFATLFGGVASQDCPDSTRRSYSGQAYFTNVDRPCVLIEDTHHAEPVTVSLDAALALVERVLETDFVDIEVAKRFVAGKASGRAEICGPSVDAFETAATPALALLAALLSALIDADAAVGGDQP